MKDDRKTKAQLLDEIEKLKRKLSEKEGGARQPTLRQDMSRRSALKIAWATPVVLSVPIAATLTSRAGASPDGVQTMEPTMSPTAATVALTLEPTLLPTNTVAPTMMPTTAFPTTEPTASGPGGPNEPTVFVPAVDAPLLSGGAAAAAAGALFAFGAKKLVESSDDDGDDGED